MIRIQALMKKSNKKLTVFVDSIKIFKNEMFCYYKGDKYKIAYLQTGTFQPNKNQSIYNDIQVTEDFIEKILERSVEDEGTWVSWLEFQAL